MPLYRKVEAFGMWSERINGTIKDITYWTRISRWRVLGGTPVLLECLTYRQRGHVGPELDIGVGLRTQEEWDYWKERDPICVK